MAYKSEQWRQEFWRSSHPHASSLASITWPGPSLCIGEQRRGELGSRDWLDPVCSSAERPGGSISKVGLSCVTRQLLLLLQPDVEEDLLARQLAVVLLATTHFNPSSFPGRFHLFYSGRCHLLRL